MASLMLKNNPGPRANGDYYENFGADYSALFARMHFFAEMTAYLSLQFCRAANFDRLKMYGCHCDDGYFSSDCALRKPFSFAALRHVECATGTIYYCPWLLRRHVCEGR